MRLGKPEKTQIIEFGPGRGTLMSDMLRVRVNMQDINFVTQRGNTADPLLLLLHNNFQLLDIGTIPQFLQNSLGCSFSRG